MKRIIDIDDEMYKRICEAPSIPDMYDTDVVNAINRIKKSTNCNNLQQTQGDLISREALKKELSKRLWFVSSPETDAQAIKDIINNAPVVENITVFDTNCVTKLRDTAIKENLPLYFVYYEEKGIIEVYETETNELFEKRHCAKHLSDYEFKNIVTLYLNNYSDWKGSVE